ncbi:hypothetical protein D3C72_2086320 [compost metagenome]
MVLHQLRQALAEPAAQQIVGANLFMADHAVATHVAFGPTTDVADVMEERRQHHLIIKTFIQRQLRRLGHVLQLRHRLADIVFITMLLIQGKYFADNLFGRSHRYPLKRFR